VEVPKGTSCYDTRELIVKAFVSNESGNNRIKALINIRQYYDINIECNKPTLTVVETETGFFQITVRNLGNGQDTLRCKIINNAELENLGCICLLDKPDMILDEGTDSIERIQVTTYSSGVRRLTIHFAVYSFSALNEENLSVERNLTLTLDIRSDGWPEIVYISCISILVIILAIVVFITAIIVRTRRKRKRQ
jgi:hypothetical protein